MKNFLLSSVFSKPEDLIIDLDLCRLILHDNKNFPWVVLIPRINDLVELVDLSKEARYQLIDEIAMIEHIMKKNFNPDKLNVATLGNVTSQLHIHIIARYKNDLAWPEPTFGKKQTNYDAEEKAAIITNIREEIIECSVKKF